MNGREYVFKFLLVTLSTLLRSPSVPSLGFPSVPSSPQYSLAGTLCFTWTQQYSGKGTRASSIFFCCSLSSGISSRCEKINTLFSIKIDIYVLTNRVKMCNKKLFRVVFTRVSKVIKSYLLWPWSIAYVFPRCVRNVYLSFHWLTDFSASSKAINLFLVYDTL